MSWLVGVFTYFLIWWVALFAVLPLGVSRDDKPEQGHDSGAPLRAEIGRKIAYTTIVATVLWLFLFVLAETGILNYRKIVSFE